MNDPKFDQFSQMREDFRAAGGIVCQHGMTLLSLVGQMQKLIFDGPTEGDATPSSAPFQALMVEREKMRSELVQKGLRKFKGNLANASKWIGINRKTLNREIERYGLSGLVEQLKRERRDL